LSEGSEGSLTESQRTFKGESERRRVTEGRKEKETTLARSFFALFLTFLTLSLCSCGAPFLFYSRSKGHGAFRIGASSFLPPTTTAIHSRSDEKETRERERERIPLSRQFRPSLLHRRNRSGACLTFLLYETSPFNKPTTVLGTLCRPFGSGVADEVKAQSLKATPMTQSDRERKNIGPGGAQAKKKLSILNPPYFSLSPTSKSSTKKQQEPFSRGAARDPTAAKTGAAKSPPRSPKRMVFSLDASASASSLPRVAPVSVLQKQPPAAPGAAPLQQLRGSSRREVMETLVMSPKKATQGGRPHPVRV